MEALKYHLLVLDIDNTIFDWVSYYVNSFWPLLEKVSQIIGVEPEKLAHEARDVFDREGSTEYPFVVQCLPSVERFYGADIERMLRECVIPCAETFKEMAAVHLVPYPGVGQVIHQIKTEFPHLKIIALTDAPRYVALWKLSKLKLIHSFDAIYGLTDPMIPVDSTTGIIKVEHQLLIKHLKRNNFGFKGLLRELPDDYEKPGKRGFKTILMDFEFENHPSQLDNILWVGDNIKKDIALGSSIGIKSAWAKYGTTINPSLSVKFNAFSPLSRILRNVSFSESEHKHTPDYILEKFSDLLPILRAPL